MNTRIPLYMTVIHDCSYLPDRDAQNLVIDPEMDLDPLMYDQLLQNGFRRSGSMIYRPGCPDCTACRSSRVNVEQFKANRSQRRAWNKVQSQLQVKPLKAGFREEHYALYQKYTAKRHHDGEMKDSSPQQFMDFLTSEWSHTLFVELHLDSKLMAIAVTDRQPQSLSALYTFFDPDMASCSPGVVAIMAQIELAKTWQLPWLYLGFFIEDCQKMSYKSRYQPIQLFENNQWTTLNRR